MSELSVNRACLELYLYAPQFISEFEQTENIELYLARQNNRLRKHYLKWQTPINDQEEEFLVICNRYKTH